MKTAAFTHCRSRFRKSPTVSLFPFLAVLICTMGALVPLLLAIARQARLQALHEATAKAAQHQVDAQAERELAQWRIEELKNARTQAETQLSQSRLALGHVENHARRLREQSAGLRASLADLEATGKKGGQRQAAMNEELEQIRTRIGQAEKQLDAARQDAAVRPRSYAVVPYQGPHGTYRQPIYLECRADAIVLQPEGVVLTAADFNGPTEVGNPLDRALRAARELLLAQKKISGNGSDEPYPLLLVRPNGIAAYYAAREAMKSWRSEIGYELVGQDWDLEFPKADPEVGLAMRTAVAEAREERRRQALLVAMLSNNGSRGGYEGIGGGAGGGIGTIGGGGGSGGVGNGTAGGVANGMEGGGPGGSTGMTGIAGASSSSTRGGAAGGFAATSFGGEGSRGGGGSPSGGTGATAGAPSTRGGSRSGSASQDERVGSDGSLAKATFGDMKSSRRGTQVVYRAAPGGGVIREEVPADSSSTAPSYRRPRNSSEARSAGASGKKGSEEPLGPFDRPAPVPAGSPPQSPDGPIPEGQAVARRNVLRPGEWVEQEPRSPKSPEDREGPDGTQKRERDPKPKPLADRRGENWGLPNAARGSVGITRPIRVRCSSNRLEILPESEGAASQAITLGTRTEDAIDGFVSALWEHMTAWGIAGRGMYWRPVLHIEVTPDAEFRYADLKALLDDSGILVERKNG